MAITLSALRVGRPRVRRDPEPWTTGFFKEPVSGRVALACENLAGDEQADLTVHGGPDKAVCVYPADHYASWRRELGVEECGPGWFGENFTVEGQTEETVCLGDVYTVGSARVQVSQPRGPCGKLARRWGRLDMPRRVVRTGRSGWYFRVLTPGSVEVGDTLALIERPYERWTIDTVSRLTYVDERGRRELANARAALAACPALAASWRADVLNS